MKSKTARRAEQALKLSLQADQLERKKPVQRLRTGLERQRFGLGYPRYGERSFTA